MKRVFIIAVFCCLSGLLWADDVPPPAADTTVTDTSAVSVSDSILSSLLIDSLATTPDTMPALPTVRLIDSLTAYFVREWHVFDIQHNDMYPRDGAGFLHFNASYFSQEYQETPQRTIVSPFGLPGEQMTIRAGIVELRPYDRVVPADGKIDFEDIATGDVARMGLVEGPLSAYDAANGGVSLLYLEPFAIPKGPATSQFIVERGAFGYAYTRGRFARRFNDSFGMSFSTDYRNGDGFRIDTKDNSYYVKSRFFLKPYRKTTVDLFLNVYRREGDFQVMPDFGGYVFNRLRRDLQYVISLTQQEFLNGQMTARFNYQSSRSQYASFSTPFYRTILPHFYSLDVSYLRQGGNGLYEIALLSGKNTYDVNQSFFNVKYADLSVSGFRDFFGGKLFALMRLKTSEINHPAYEAVVGYSGKLSPKWKSLFSIGYTTRFPDAVERYTPARDDPIGGSGSLAFGFLERGNPGLQTEKRLSGNVTLSYLFNTGNISVSLNGGTIDDVIYYDRRFISWGAMTVFPANDNLQFLDANISADLQSLGPFYSVLSATYRKIDSDRFGNRPPYSPRWQMFGRLGLKHYISKYDIYARAFGEITYCDKLLSYQLNEVDNAVLVTWGVNASMQSFTFYYMMHNALNQVQSAPEGYGYTGWFYSWGINWKFID